MWEFWSRFFVPTDSPAHRAGNRWPPELGWLHIGSDLGVGVAYIAISIALGLFAWRQKDVPLRNLFWLLGAFALLYGTTHLIEAALFWWPVYRLAGLVKLAAAVVSWVVALSLLRMPSTAVAPDAPEDLDRAGAERRRAEAALRASEEYLRAVVDAAPDAIVTTDESGRITGWNRAAERMFGYPIPEALGLNLRAVFPGYASSGTGTPAPQWGDSAVVIHEPVFVTTEGLRRNGSAFPVDLSGNTRGAGPGAYHILTARDATERMRARAALVERAQAASARAGVAAVVATGGDTRAALQACCEGLVRELGTAFVRVWTLAESDPVLEPQAGVGLGAHIDGPHARGRIGQFVIERIAERGQPYATSNAPEDPEVGDREWCHREGLVAFAGFPLLSEGRVAGVLATFSRVPIRPAACEALAAAADLIAQFVERRRAEDAMQLRDRALSSFAQGVAIADASRPDYPLVYVNPGFEAMTGYAAAEVLGRNCRFLQGTGTDLADVDAVRAAVREGRPLLVEVLNYRKDGTPFWNALSVAPVRDGAGRLTHVVAVRTDISSLKKLKSQLLQSQKMEAIGHLAGGIAHDFNNLLTIITGFATVALESLPPGASAAEQLAEVIAAAGRAADLTRQLLAFSRQQILRPRPVALNDLVTGVQKMLARVIGEDVRLSTALHPSTGTVLVDPGQIEQVLLNLVVNARDAMPTGGLLTIETMPAELDAPHAGPRPELRTGRYALLAVTDTGCGMTDEVRARIFEPFFTTKEVGKGTGLGLATVFGIVKQSGGHVEVVSAAGRGSSFRVYLPETRPECGAGVVERPPVPSGHETVLLVEDEAHVRALAGTALRRAGYAVLEASGAEEAERVVAGRDRPVDLLLTDVVMPGTSGRVLAERLKAAAPGLPVMFMSGYTDDAVVRHGLLSAEVAFLQKPFTIEALLRKVRDVLDKS